MSTLTWEHRICDIVAPVKPAAGLDAAVDRCIGFWKRRGSLVAALRADARAAGALEEEFRALTEEALERRIEELRGRFRRDSIENGRQLHAALAAVREVAARQLGMRPFEVQLMGVLALHRGYFAEMATGEGKSLTAALAATLAGWSGRPCHVITVNDYLASRDAERFAPLYRFCGLTAGHVVGTQSPHERARGHAADVCYTTSKEIVADFLRDRLCLGERQSATSWAIQFLQNEASTDATRDGVVMRGLHTAIIDEADSVLIDEAVTPLIIAGAAGNDESSDAYEMAWTLAVSMMPGVDYRAHHARREIQILPPGVQAMQVRAPKLPALWRAASRQRELLTQALTAREFYHRDKQYLVDQGNVVIVDEFTGRPMPMRKWRHGLHQAIEAKEGVAISPLDETLARLSFQRFFRFFRRLSGMSGTAAEAAGELWNIYRLPVVHIPTHRPSRRVDLPDRVFVTAEEKWAAVVDEVVRRHATGQPVLIGTRNVAVSEQLARRLAARKLEVSVLNAARHLEEARIVEDAGGWGRITIATNMAGRGTDIVLGLGVAEVGGLHVIATERHESGRIDRQLYGRAGRQGDAGSSEAFSSLEDELLLRFANPMLVGAFRSIVKQKIYGWRRVTEFLFSHAQSVAQKKAFKQRRNVLRQDDWLDETLAFVGGSK